MYEKPIRNDTVQIYCSVATRNLIHGLKRGGETYEDLLRRMADQYNPTVARNHEGTEDGV